MITCIAVALAISCTNTEPRPTPAQAVHVLTSSVQPWIPPFDKPNEFGRYYVAPDTARSEFGPPRLSLPPQSHAWSVTTYAVHGNVATWLNGQLISGYPGPGTERYRFDRPRR